MTAPALTFDRLALERAGQPILLDATATVAAGELVALKGASGAGKTTLVRAIAGLDPFQAGTVQVGDVCLAAGRPPTPEERRRLYRLVGVVFQFHHLFANLTAQDNVSLALVHVHGITPAEAAHRARALLDRLGVAHRAGALPHALSGGEAQRIAIARALAVEPALLLLDEPTASLDPDRRLELADLLRGLARDGRALVVATHDVDFAHACATREFTLRGGRLLDDRPQKPDGPRRP